MNKKTFLLTARTPEELKDLINSEKREFFASNIIPDYENGGWIAFCWYEPKLANERPNYNWRTEDASEAQKNKMKELNIKYPQGITKGEASILISEKNRK